MSARPALYADPALYDLLHAGGTGDEAWLLDRVAARFGALPRAALEPACGTGRYLEALRRRGWEVEGYDRDAGMLAFARRRLARRGPRARVRRGDMRRDRPARRFGLVFNLLSSFRHLESDREALAHLRSCARALAPRGIMVLGLDLARYGRDEDDEETWAVRRGGRLWRQVQLCLAAGRRRRRERVLNFVTRPDGGVLESSHDLRSYDWRQLSALLARSPLRPRSCLGPDGRPRPLRGAAGPVWVVLSARARRVSPRPGRRRAAGGA